MTMTNVPQHKSKNHKEGQLGNPSKKNKKQLKIGK
jgi:hypothetical protein